MDHAPNQRHALLLRAGIERQIHGDSRPPQPESQGLGWDPELAGAGGILTSDYAIVTRAFNPTIEQTFVSVAGATGYGTYAAGEFLANEDYFAAALHDAPRDGYRKNMQVVLSVKVISGTPGPPRC